ncbi:MAG: DUF2442 domain-containing protein [Spirochaetales bacterium]
MIHHVVEVKPMPEHSLWLKFDTQETKIFDVTPFLTRGRFAQLQDWSVFSQTAIAYGTVEWANGLDLDPEDLYELSVPAT